MVVVALSGGDVTTVQDGVNLAARLPGRSVALVCPGVYREQVACSQNVDIVGISREAVIIVASNGCAITARGTPGIRVANLTATRTSPSAGPAILADAGISLERLIVRANNTGVIGVQPKARIMILNGQ